MNKIKIAAFALFLTASSSVSANPITCTYQGAPDWVEPIPKIELNCQDVGTPFQSCTDFKVFLRDSQRFSDQDLGVPKQDGILAFHPTAISFLEVIEGGDGYPFWVLYLSEPGGGNKAQERWVVFDHNNQTKTPLMNKDQWDRWIKTKNEQGTNYPSYYTEEIILLSPTCK